MSLTLCRTAVVAAFLASFLCIAQSAGAEPIEFSVAGDKEQVILRFEEEGLREPTFSMIAGDQPKLVIDIAGIRRWKGREQMPVDGRSVRTVRSALHRQENKLRVVLDLAADPSTYFITHTYLLEGDRRPVVVIVRSLDE